MEQKPTNEEKEQSLENFIYKVPTSPLIFTMIAALLAALIYLTLPAKLTIGPSWIPLAIELITFVPIALTRLLKHPIPYKYTRLMFCVMLAIITVAFVIVVVILVYSLPQRGEAESISLLRTGVSLWVGNILLFSLWYWEIDGGGPKQRHENGNKADDFLFPQQVDGNKSHWVPHLIDYLFLSFTGATALSPADTVPLTHRAKLMMILEACIALILLSILIGRAINIL